MLNPDFVQFGSEYLFVEGLFFIMQFRFISTCTKVQASKMQLGRILNKVMQQDRTKKSNKESLDSSAVLTNFSKTPKKVTSHKSRRVTVLNKVFMKYITDLMATGEVASTLVGRGIEISHVNVAPDFSMVNVYWIAQNESVADECTERILKASAGHLQHELSQLRVIGLVPPINFVKNKHYAVVKEVEDCLSRVDFGEDYTPTAHVINLKAPVLKTSLSAELKARISQIDSSNIDNEDIVHEINIPKMRQDILGFNHLEVMSKVRGSMNKSKVAEQSNLTRSPGEPQGNRDPTSAEVKDFLSSKEQSKLFGDFLRKRMIEEKRKQRSIPLFEVKLQEEMDWMEEMKDRDEVQECEIDESYRDEYNDLESK